MTGERRGWFRVASHLGIPVAEIKTRITHSEFIEWLVFLEKEDENRVKAEYYQAQIAAEIRRTIVKNPRSVKVKDFLLKLGSAEKVTKSKGCWAAALGIKVED